MLKQFLDNGLNASVPSEDAKHIQILNALCILLIPYIAIYLVATLWFWQESLASLLVMHSVFVCLVTASFLLNRQGRYRTARFVFSLAVLSEISIVSFGMGRGALFHVFLLSGFFTAFYLFPHRERIASVVLAAFFFALWIFFEALWFPYHSGPSLPDGYRALLWFVTISVGLPAVFLFKAVVCHLAFHHYDQQLRQQNTVLECQARELLAEKAKSDQLLGNILPVRILSELKSTGHIEPREFPEVTVFFSDIVGFTQLSQQVTPRFLIDELNEIFTAFDEIFERQGCERIKTIGDAYLGVCGMSTPRKDHTACVLRAAAEIIEFLARRNMGEKVKWEVRCGVHTGSLVGGIVGIRKYIFDIFGDTVNTAARLESHSAPMRVNVSDTVKVHAGTDFKFVERGVIDVKGKGSMTMFWLDLPEL